MDQGSLVRDEIDAGAEFVRAFDQYAPVEVAFWMKSSDDSQKYLHIASKQIDDSNFDLAYREVHRLKVKMPSLFLDMFQIKVLSADTPLARAAAELNHRFPDPLGNRVGGQMMGGIYIDQGYIYPSPLPAAVL